MLGRIISRTLFSLLIFVLFSSSVHAQKTTSNDHQSLLSDGPTGTQAIQTGSHTGFLTGSQTHSGTSNSQSAPKTSVSVNPVDPPGGVSMITPAASDSSSTYYSVGATITFSWNYTSVQVTPTAIAVEAYCSVNKFYYPIASNLSFDDSHVVWDTEAYDANATQPLLTAMYTLYIYDEGRSVTAIPSAGILGSYNGFVFGLYQLQAYSDLPSNTCVICSGAKKMLLPNGIWWSIGLGAAFLVGGWRVIAG